jgi:opacity protein-like surface antigen
MAEPGFYVGLGYDELNNGLEADYNVNSGPHAKVEINSPCKMYTLSLGYIFNDNLAINGKFSNGNTDFAKLSGGSEDFELSGSVDQDNRLWQIEGVYQWFITDNLKIGGIAGYQNSENTINGKFAYDNFGSSISGSGKIAQKFHGPSIGALVTYNPTEQLELGVSYRQLINPDGRLDASGNMAYYYGEGSISDSAKKSFDADDLKASIIEIYGKTAISENWSAKVGYTYSKTEYSLTLNESDIDVTNTTKGLWARVEYKF